jgi:UDP-glucose 4-epimerase
MTKILVTGAAGFIGSHTVDLLLGQGHTVRGVDNLRTGKRANLNLAAQNSSFLFLEQDCAAPVTLDTIVREYGPDAIIHLAAMVSVPESIANPMENDRLNFQATCLVAEAAKTYGVKRIVFASSAAVYGKNPNLPLTEDAYCLPLSPYGEAKLKSEKLLLELSRTHGIVVRCHRYFNVFGPRQDPSSSYSGVISLFSNRLMQGISPAIHGDGEQTRDFIHVSDVARANLIAATAPDITSGVANICTGQSVSLNTLYSTLSQVIGKKLPPDYGPPREGDIRHSCGSPERAKWELGFTAQTPLAKGLQTLCN